MLHVLGALDGKQVAIVKPPKSMTIYYNYKGCLMALVDADFEFIQIDTGGGHQSDVQFYRESNLY